MSQFEKLIVTYHNLLRRLIEGRFKHIGNNDRDFQYKLNNEKVHVICCTSDVSSFIRKQQKDYASHVVRMHTERCDKQLMFNDDKYEDKYHRIGRVTPSLI